MVWIYKYSWYETKRHKISYTDMYFLEPNNLHENCSFIEDVKKGLARVHYIYVEDDSDLAKTAKENTDREKENIKKEEKNNTYDEKKEMLYKECKDIIFGGSLSLVLHPNNKDELNDEQIKMVSYIIQQIHFLEYDEKKHLIPVEFHFTNQK